jgi:hypothetical protein
MGTIILLAVTAATVFAFWKILPRAGLSEYWAFVAIIPLGAVVLLLVLALRPWPGDPDYRGAS